MLLSIANLYQHIYQIYYSIHATLVYSLYKINKNKINIVVITYRARARVRERARIVCHIYMYIYTSKLKNVSRK